MGIDKFIDNETLLKMVKEDSTNYIKIDNPIEEISWTYLRENPLNIKLVKSPTEEMIKYSFIRGCINAVSMIGDWAKISEDDIITAINNSVVDAYTIMTGCIFDKMPEDKITRKIVEAQLRKHALYITSEKVEKYIDESLIDIVVEKYIYDYNKKIAEGSKFGVNYSLVKVFKHFTKKHFDEIFKSMGTYFVANLKYEDSKLIPEYIIAEYVKETKYSYKKYLSKDNSILWYETYKNEEYHIGDFFESTEFSVNILEKYGEAIQYIKNPNKKEKLAAIRNNGMNLQYIKVQTENICLEALKQNKDALKFVEKKTEKICNFVGITHVEEAENIYPAENYLVSMTLNLADEGDLFYSEVIPGKEMEKFMNSYTSISFGNLDDDNKYLVKDIASCSEISDNEIKVLKKFGLDSVSSGYWHGLD